MELLVDRDLLLSFSWLFSGCFVDTLFLAFYPALLFLYSDVLQSRYALTFYNVLLCNYYKFSLVVFMRIL